jgi:hypothetical protein
VEKKVKTTWSGNACIHGMTHVTTASLAYVATQVWFVLCWWNYYWKLCQLHFVLLSTSVFCRSDT